ncbi:2-C-methyl-D-erythritol 4-phosphate cytidylyltransferase [Euzebya pacifica]|uniref:2-C-methyl-D-erythritol 4-phosphate cytidylyltransferase n=1 Tax=Euzebya pacifica TaxID=1608957 RepID=UPI0030FC14ED
MTAGPAIRVGLVIVAAGSGTRLGHDHPKAFVRLGGRSLLAHALDRLAPAAHEVVVVGPPEHMAETGVQVERSGTTARIVPGGLTRTGSVAAGISALGTVDVIAVHDAARPLVDAAALRRAVAAVVGGADASAPALPVTDTLKEVADGEVVTRTVDRSALRAVQTPQVFRADVLRAAHARGDDATDDLALVEAGGGTVVLVPGRARYLKVTYPDDLLLAEAFLAAGEPEEPE